METIVSTEGLSKEYGGVFRVKHVDLQIREGEVYGFLGPNGAGKSTTMKMLLGLVKPTQGTVHLFGKQMNDKNRVEILRQTGALIESPSYYGHLTAWKSARHAEAAGHPGETCGRPPDCPPGTRPVKR